MKSAHPPLWVHAHFYPQQNQSISAKSPKSCRKSVIMTSEQREVAPRCHVGELPGNQSHLMAHHPTELGGQPWRSLAHSSSAWMSIRRRWLSPLSRKSPVLPCRIWAPWVHGTVLLLNSSAR